MITDWRFSFPVRISSVVVVGAISLLVYISFNRINTVLALLAGAEASGTDLHQRISTMSVLINCTCLAVAGALLKWLPSAQD